MAPFVALPAITSLDRARRVRSTGGGLGGGGLPRALREPRVRRRRLGRGRRPRHHLQRPQNRVDEHRRGAVVEVHPVQRRAHGREEVRVLHAPLQVTGVPPLEVLALAVILGTRRGPRGFTPRVRQESVDQIHKRSSGSRAFASVLRERIRRFQRDAHLVKHPASRLRRSDAEREEKVRGSFAAVPTARRGPAVLVGFAELCLGLGELDVEDVLEQTALGALGRRVHAKDLTGGGAVHEGEIGEQAKREGGANSRKRRRIHLRVNLLRVNLLRVNLLRVNLRGCFHGVHGCGAAPLAPLGGSLRVRRIRHHRVDERLDHRRERRMRLFLPVALALALGRGLASRRLERPGRRGREVGLPVLG